MTKILIDEAVVRQALEALEVVWKDHQAITALQEALAEQPAQQEPVVLDPKDVKIETLCTQRGGGFLSVMTSGVRLTHAPTGITVEETSDRSLHRNKATAWERLTQLVAAPPAPAQEPVPSIIKQLGHCPECGAEARHFTPPAPAPDPDELTIAYMSGVYEGKKRKPWVGLTDEEINDIEATWEATQEWVSFRHATRVIEAKLKEKNA